MHDDSMKLGFEKIVLMTGFLGFSTLTMMAETIKGTIVDKQSKEPLTGATVQVLGTTVGAVPILTEIIFWMSPVVSMNWW